MNHRRVEILGREGIPIGHVELIHVGQPGAEYKVVVQFRPGLQVVAVRSEMSSGRISGILGRLTQTEEKHE